MHTLARPWLFIALASLLVLISTPRSGLAQSDAPIIRIIDIKTDQAPLLEAQLGYSRANGAPFSDEPAVTVTVNGTRISDVTMRAEQRQLAVAIVTDLSARMSDQGTGLNRLSANLRFNDMSRLVTKLVSELSTNGHLASLVTFDRQVTVAHPLTYDLGAINNTLNNANSAQRFEPAPLASADPSDPYLLNEALLEALNQLAAAPEDAPRVLVVFTSGDPAFELSNSVRIRLTEQQQLKRPVYLLVFGLGSDQPEAFDRFPANPDGLAQLAASAGGQFIAIGTTAIDAQTQNMIDQAWSDVRQLAKQYRLQFPANAIGPGIATITVAAGTASDSVQFDLDAIPPRFEVVVDTRNFQDQVRLGIEVVFQQAPISRVEYFLNNLPLGSSEQAPDFAYRFNAYDSAFQQQFPPGSYELTAAAFDSNGNQSRSETPLAITVFAPPPPPTLIEQIGSWLPWLLGGVLVLGGLGFWLWRSRTAKGHPQASPTPTPGHFPKIEEPTIEHQLKPIPPPPAEDQPSGLTTEFKPKPPSNDVTTEFKGAATRLLRSRWYVEVLEGKEDLGRRFELTGDRRYFDIGRANPPDPGPDFVMRSSLVSKGSHARLCLLQQGKGIELIAGASRNGTFVGLDQQELAPNTRRILNHNDIFWLSPGVKLRVVEEDVP